MNCCSACSVDPRLLTLEEVVASSVLVMNKGVEPKGSVVGFDSVAVVNAIIPDDANVVEPGDMDVE